MTAEDQFDNPVSAYDGTIHFTSGDSQATLPSDGTLVDGIGNFVATLRTAGVQSLAVADTGNVAISGFTNVTVEAGAATRFAFSTPAGATAGTSFTVMVSAIDAYNNVAVGYDGTVRFSSRDNNSQTILPANGPLSNGVGSFNVTLTTAGTQTLAVNDTASALTASSTITVSPGTASKFLITGTPSGSVAAGSAFSFTVTALDADNNVANGYSGTIHFTSTDNNTQTLLPADSTLSNGAGVFNATLTTAGAQTITATDLLNGSVAGTSSKVIVIPLATAASLAVSAPTNTKAGASFALTVTARDVYGNTATGYAGTVHFTSTDAQSVLPANYTFNSSNDGVETFGVTLKTRGNQTVTATDTVNAKLSTAESFVVSGVATHFFLSVPASVTAGVPFNFTVTALDAFNNTASNYAGTVHFTSTGAGATLPLNASLTNGVGTFTAILTKAGAVSLTASDTVAPTTLVATKSITVSAGAATHFLVSAPASAAAGTPLKISVTAQDAYGNTTTGYTGTVHFTSSDGAATLPADTTLTRGGGTFRVTLWTSGSQTVDAADSLNDAIVGVSNPVAVSTAAAGYAIQLAASSLTAGATLTFTVTAVDGSGNTATGYTGTVQFSSSDPKAVFATNKVKLINGVGTFKITLKTAGPQTITATDSANPSITGTNNTLTVYAAAASKFVFNGVPTGAIVAGTPISFTVTALDAYGNTATGYGGTVHFTSSDTYSQTSLPGDTTLTGGVGTFSATLTKAGAQTLKASDLANKAILGVSGTIPVIATTAAAFIVSAPAGATPGVAFTVTVTAVDQYGNNATSYDGSVQLTSSDSYAVLPAAKSFVGATGTFTVVLHSGGDQTVTATDVANSLTGTSGEIFVGQGKHS